MDKTFWANIRSISQKVGYTVRGADQIKIPTLAEIQSALISLDLSTDHIIINGSLTEFGQNILEYYTYRADQLNSYVVNQLTDAEEAKSIYNKMVENYIPKSPQPLNKQKGDKKAPAYLTCIINTLIEKNLENLPCTYDPRELTTITKDGTPLRTLARWVDGAFPSPVNPIAIWEIKEYYYTTTFGSRVADGIYETLLDGLELEELEEHSNIKVKHYLFIDSRYTWWVCGKAYLCRLIDMLHMGYVDEILFGKEVLTELPRIVKEWKESYKLKK